MIYGVGIDIVDIRRFKRALDRYGERFERRLFTGDELKYCTNKSSPERHLAARFAAKEAFFKAVGLRNGLKSFKDVYVASEPTGAPVLMAPALDPAFKLHLSLSHDGDYSVAQVVVDKISGGLDE